MRVACVFYIDRNPSLNTKETAETQRDGKTERA